MVSLNLTHLQISHLEANWGDLMLCLACHATLRVYDTQGPFECFLLAMNPQDHDEVYCLIACGMMEPTAEHCRLSELQAMYNSHGEPLEIDTEYRPRLAYQILQQLREKYARH